MSALALKRWTEIQEGDNSDGTRLWIEARESGLLAWLFGLIGLDPTHSLRVTQSHIVYRTASWSGHITVCLPLCRLTATAYGFVRPWKEALVLGIILLPIFGLGLLIGPLYYFLNRQLLLGFTDVGGTAYNMSFKRGVFEGVGMNAERAATAAELIQKLADAQL